MGYSEERKRKQAEGIARAKKAGRIGKYSDERKKRHAEGIAKAKAAGKYKGRTPGTTRLNPYLMAELEMMVEKLILFRPDRKEIEKNYNNIAYDSLDLPRNRKLPKEVYRQMQKEIAWHSASRRGKTLIRIFLAEYFGISYGTLQKYLQARARMPESEKQRFTTCEVCPREWIEFADEIHELATFKDGRANLKINGIGGEQFPLAMSKRELWRYWEKQYLSGKRPEDGSGNPFFIFEDVRDMYVQKVRPLSRWTKGDLKLPLIRLQPSFDFSWDGMLETDRLWDEE